MILSVIILISLFTFGTATPHPGVLVHLTKRALDYACEFASTLLTPKIDEIPIPDYLTDQNLWWIISAGFQIRNASISSVQNLTFSYALQPPNMLYLSANSSSAQAHGLWAVWFRFLFTIYIDGTFLLHTGTITANVHSELARTQTDGPEVQFSNCSSQIQSLDLQIQGGFLAWILSWFTPLIMPNLKALIQKRICSEGFELLDSGINNTLTKFNMRQSLTPELGLDLGFIRSPFVAEEYIDLYLRGEVYLMNSSNSLPFLPPKFSSSISSDRMVSIFGSDYLLNSFFFIGHYENLFRLRITKDTFPNLKQLLRTTCSTLELCIGRGKIGKLFPNTFVQIEIASAIPPASLIVKDGIVLTGTAFVQLYVEQPKSIKFLMNGYASIDAGIQAKMIKNRLVGSVKIQTLEANLTRSEIGHLPQFEIDLILDVSKPYLKHTLNERLKKGVRLPKFEGLEAVRPNISMIVHAMVLSSDVEYG